MDAHDRTRNRAAAEGNSPGAPQDEDALLARASSYASTVDIAVDLDAVSWEISDRAKRRAGVCLYNGDGSVTIRLTWDAYQSYGWTEFTDVIRHELVHAWEFQQYGESDHGERFRRKADEVGASRHCRTFAEPRVRLRCTDDDCGWTADRHRASTVVTDPADRRCGTCGARYLVEHVETGERWETKNEYENARERIGGEW